MGNTYEVRGRITTIGEIETRGASFRVRKFILDDSEPGAKYPNPMEFELQKDQADTYIAQGPAVVRFAINGRFWAAGGKHFVSLKAFSVAQDVSAPMPAPIPAAPAQPTAATPAGKGEDDDLSF